MSACRSRLGAALGVWFAVFAGRSIDARAQEPATAPAKGGVCPNIDAAFADPMSKPRWNGWGVDPTQHRFQPADMARLAPSDAPRLKLKWAFGFPGVNRSVAQPTVFGGRVFVGSLNGKVYSLDAKSGCTYWAFDAGKGVRSAIVIGPHGDGWAAYFGDFGANVHSIDALTGKELWTAKVDDHPAAIITGSPTLVGTMLLSPSHHMRRSQTPTRLTHVAASGAASSRWTRLRGKCCGRRIRSLRKPSRARSTSGAFSFWGGDLVGADLRRGDPKTLCDDR